MLDHEKQIKEYETLLDKIKEQNQENDVWSPKEVRRLELKVESLKQEVYSNLTPWDRVLISRHKDRPHGIDYIEKMFDTFEELHGDRQFRDDPAIIGGFAELGGKKFVVIAQEKGNDTQSRLKRNFGMSHPEGYRKALRLMKLAEKFSLPIISLVDTPGAYPGIAAEERGQGNAIAENLMHMSRLKTPIIVILIGEGCSGGALGVGIGDVIGMLQHSYYSVISPEGCASILWKDTSKNSEASEMLQMQSEYLLEANIVDEVIDEPTGGAHNDPEEVFRSVSEFVLRKLKVLEELDGEQLVEKRYKKFRDMGEFERTL